MELKIEYLQKEDLKPYANNAKIHTAEQIEQIKRSIEEFGFNDPIAVWQDNEIVEGHGRLLAVMEMDDVEKVPVIKLDGLDDEQRRAYMLVHNKINMNTGFDLELLAEELADIDIDMSEFGFETFEQNEINEPKEVEYKEKISVVVECESETEAEEIFNKLTNEGYVCRISTL